MYEKIVSRSSLIAAAVIVALMPNTRANAEAAAVEAKPGQLEEIVVTARKRQEDIREVPVSVAAMSTDDLAQRGATNLMDLGNVVPNVIVGTGNSERRTNLVIRGISTEARSIGQETGVGVYLDGVYTGRAETYNQQLPDISQVEFLRGPQGTIFGKNTIAGAISLTTIKPGDEILGSVLLEAGNFGHYEADGFISGPLKQGLLYGKIAAYGMTEDGYAKNVYDDTRVGGRNKDGVRVQLRATPTDSLELNLSADVSRSDGVPYRFEVTTGTYGNVPGPYTIDEAYRSWEKIDYSGTALTADYTFESGYVLTSITAYRRSAWDTNSDETWNGFNHAYAQYEQSSDYTSEELRVTSPSAGKLKYVAGFYYSYQNSGTHTPVFIGDGLADLFGIPYGWLSFDERADVRTNGYAAFANATYDVTDKWNLTVGGRYTYEKKDLNFQQFDPNGLGFVPNLGPLTESYSDDQFTPTVSAVYKLNADVNLYATYATGYKSGGFNVDTLSTTDNLSFKPEYTDNYEVGAKTAFLDGHVQANLALFYMRYTDLQVTQYDPASFANYIGNAAKATVKGMEFELAAQPTEHVTLHAGVGLIDATFDEFIDQYGNNLKGNDLPFAPRVTADLSGEYSWPVGATDRGFVWLEGVYHDSSYPDIANDPRNKLGAYTLLNARAGFTFANGKWTLEAYGRNLTDTLYVINRQTTLPLLSFLPEFNYDETTTTYGAPRTYGVRLTARF